jgi:hypothetical protein
MNEPLHYGCNRRLSGPTRGYLRELLIGTRKLPQEWLLNGFIKLTPESVVSEENLFNSEQQTNTRLSWHCGGTVGLTG